MSDFITNSELRMEAERLCDENEGLKAENAELVRVLHEVEREAVHAYKCLQKDCETITGSASHYFDKWWHAECQNDRLKAENAKLRLKLGEMAEVLLVYAKSLDDVRDGIEADCPHTTPVVKAYLKDMRELGVEVDE